MSPVLVCIRFDTTKRATVRVLRVSAELHAFGMFGDKVFVLELGFNYNIKVGLGGTLGLITTEQSRSSVL